MKRIFNNISFNALNDASNQYVDLTPVSSLTELIQLKEFMLDFQTDEIVELYLNGVKSDVIQRAPFNRLLDDFKIDPGISLTGRIVYYPADNFTVTSTVNDEITFTNGGYWHADPIYFTTTGTLPAPLSVNTQYWLHQVSGKIYTLHTVKSDSYGGYNKVNITDAGSGVHSVNSTRVLSASGATVQTNFTNELAAGDKIISYNSSLVDQQTLRVASVNSATQLTLVAAPTAISHDDGSYNVRKPNTPYIKKTTSGNRVTGYAKYTREKI